MMNIRSVEVKQPMLQVHWSDGATRAFPLIWLRDNCRCQDCLHPYTRERTFDLLSVPEQLSSPAVNACGETLEIQWQEDAHISRFEGDWLRRQSVADEPASAAKSLETRSIAGTAAL